MRAVLQAVIANAKVTHAGDSYAVRIDPFILNAAGMLPFERVEVINAATRERVETWVEPAQEGSGEVHVQNVARVGDTIAIVAFTFLHEGQTLAHQPMIVTLDDRNAVISAQNR